MSRPEKATAIIVASFTHNQEFHVEQAIPRVFAHRRHHAIHALRLYPLDGRFSPAGILFMLRTPETASVRILLVRASAAAGMGVGEGNRREREDVSDSRPRGSAQR
jgi:hypothetical protein